jgi:3-isopropylmalate/(R)-2-methylmalate dehydratase small subunit
VRAWVFGDDVSTDAIAPGRYMKSDIDEMAKHCLETFDPAFAKGVRFGDVLVAGRNFGAGSSREQAPAALKHLGIAALIAESFAGLFYRNSLNLGLPALVCPEARQIHNGDELKVSYEESAIYDLSTRAKLAFEPIPPHLWEMVLDGGLLPHLEKRLKCRTTS